MFSKISGGPIALFPSLVAGLKTNLSTRVSQQGRVAAR